MDEREYVNMELCVHGGQYFKVHANDHSRTAVHLEIDVKHGNHGQSTPTSMVNGERYSIMASSSSSSFSSLHYHVF